MAVKSKRSGLTSGTATQPATSHAHTAAQRRSRPAEAARCSPESNTTRWLLLRRALLTDATALGRCRAEPQTLLPASADAHSAACYSPLSIRRPCTALPTRPCPPPMAPARRRHGGVVPLVSWRQLLGRAGVARRRAGRASNTITNGGGALWGCAAPSGARRTRQPRRRRRAPRRNTPRCWTFSGWGQVRNRHALWSLCFRCVGTRCHVLLGGMRRGGA
jgi:hypothetical protein